MSRWRPVPRLACAFVGLALLFLGQGSDAPSAKDLLERIRSEGAQVPLEVFEQLGARRDRAGLEALQEGIRSLDDFRALRAAHTALTAYAADPELAPRAVAFLEEELKQTVLSRRWGAPRTLGFFGDAGFALIEKAARDATDPHLRARAIEALLPELRRRGDAGSLAIVLQGAEPNTDAERKALLEALGEFRGKGLGRALSAGLADRGAPSTRKCLVVRGLAPVAGDDIDAALVKVLSDGDYELVRTCIEVLGQRGHTGHTRILKRLAKHDDLSLRYAAIRALIELPDEDAKGAWTQRLHEGLAARTPLEKLAAVATLVAMRRPGSIGALIEQLAREQDPAIQTELVGALRGLTGLDHGNSATRWASWWKDAGATFVLPDPSAAQQAELERRRVAWRNKKRYDFYGLQIASRRVCFVLDASGSMKAENKDGVSRFEVAQRTLSDTLERFPDGGYFNVIFFGTRVEAYTPDLVEMNAARRIEVAARIETQKLLGLTAIYDALREAFRSQGTDAIYLLSDGSPLGGEVDDVDEIRLQVAAWNAQRKSKVTIHCIALGGGHRLLEWLARDSGGEYVQVEDD